MISSSTLERFLVAFVNHGWPDSDYATFEDVTSRKYDVRVVGPGKLATWTQKLDHYRRSCEATAAWLQKQRLFRQMLPKQPRGNSPGQQILVWQNKVQRAWRPNEVQLRKHRILDLVAFYGAFALTNPDALNEGGEFHSHVERLLNRRSTGIGLKPDGFLQSLRQALEVASRMRFCKNPICEHPFFLVRRKSDRFCSRKCALVGKREAKRQWWLKKGKQWLETSESPTAQRRRKGRPKRKGKVK